MRQSFQTTVTCGKAVFLVLISSGLTVHDRYPQGGKKSLISVQLALSRALGVLNFCVSGLRESELQPAAGYSVHKLSHCTHLLPAA